MANKIQIDLIGKPGCHLCETAELELAGVLTEFSKLHPAAEIQLVQRSILDDPALAARHSEEIPVLLVNGQMHSYWRIDAKRLTAKLEELI
ncbi:MAG: glutaredoxin family protein [Micrococcales bacterium]